MYHEVSCVQRNADSSTSVCHRPAQGPAAGLGRQDPAQDHPENGYDTDTDVRESLEVQEVEKERRKAKATPIAIAQRKETVN